MSKYAEGDGEKRHGGWNSLENYLFQHEKRLEGYQGFVESWSGSPELIGSTGDDAFLIRLRIEIICIGNIVIDVDKTIDVLVEPNNRILARTKEYSYNVSISGKGTIFRYDNAHIHNGHSSNNHKHIFTEPNKDERVVCLNSDFPHMHEIVEEARDWYYC